MLAAAGNSGDSGDAPVYPGAYPEAIAVGAFQENLTRAPFSNTGSYVDVERARQRHPLDVVDVADELRSGERDVDGDPVRVGRSRADHRREPEAARPRRVTSILESTARDVGPPGVDTQYGHGLIDPAAAVYAAMPKIPGYGSKGDGYWIVGPLGSGARVREGAALRQ